MKAIRRQTQGPHCPQARGSSLPTSSPVATHPPFHQDQWQGSELCCTPGRSVRADSSEPVHKVAVASPGGHRHHRGFGEKAAGRADGRTLASWIERYPQLFAESVSTFGSEAIHKAILIKINQRAYQRQTPAETTDQNLLFNDALFTAPIVWRLIIRRILLLNYERRAIYCIRSWFLT